MRTRISGMDRPCPMTCEFRESATSRTARTRMVRRCQEGPQHNRGSEIEGAEASLA